MQTNYNESNWKEKKRKEQLSNVTNKKCANLP
jgi:hypothetical protein